MDFSNLDFGSQKPYPAKIEDIHVSINTDYLSNFAKAFVRELHRKAPTLADDPAYRVSTEEVVKYCHYLLERRVHNVHGQCNNFRQLKVLWIPAWIQFCLSQIGEVTIRDYGIKLIPECDDCELTFDEAKVISDKIGMFEDYVSIVKDAMPRGIEGDPYTMSMAVIDGYVRSFQKDAHPVHAYVGAFLNLQIAKDNALKSIYRMTYDDVQYILSALTSGGEIFR